MQKSSESRTDMRIRVASILLLAVLLCSLIFIAAEAHHDCCGEDCLICACIRVCTSALRSVSLHAAVKTVLAAVSLCLSAALIFLSFRLNGVTPVIAKVRLNR